jgi:hypothetical protein
MLDWPRPAQPGMAAALQVRFCEGPLSSPDLPRKKAPAARGNPARLTPNPPVYWPIAVWSILATAGEGRLSALPARPKAASSGATPRSSLMDTFAP